ncbi:MAG TPA: IPExxxVDY family protein [Flavobacteriaceae bacterium]|nr:IPExxxVDY family protein [Flavobacteriaceae bacterium]
MAVKKYILDVTFDEEEALLFAIHSSLENYRMAYFLNKNLPLLLKRQEEFYTIKQAEYESEYMLYRYKDEANQDVFYFINNAAEIQTSAVGEIFQGATPGKTYLAPEIKKADYLLKICTEDTYFYRNNFLPVIQSIPGVITAYEVEYDSLKSKIKLQFE